jgi:hypothetical protein
MKIIYYYLNLSGNEEMESKFKTESGLTNDKYCIMFMKRKLITYL